MHRITSHSLVLLILLYQITIWYIVLEKSLQGANSRSLRNYSVDVYKQALERASCPDYENFDNLDIEYNNFINRLDCVVNAVAPFKVFIVKNNTNEWFDWEIADKIHTCDKLDKRFKLTKLHVDEEIHKEALNIVQNLIQKVIKVYFDEKLKENKKVRKKTLESIKTVRSARQKVTLY